ncbi:MAG TPA: peptidoglycan DD-metalloendopeptidase family protein [Thermoanaerobaculia bacterium]|jgi:murein DD-endopeptidase MepM/ murein hydrolase activator NlpD|nr:peptidoglycan DD-metalloendopeptidase family protein [Thermoanaerobaculia bacterium]
MKTFRALGVRLGGVVKRPRVYVALALPLAVPLFLAAVRAQPEYGTTARGTVLPPPALRYHDLREPFEITLPEHSLILTIEKNDTLDKILVAGGLSRGESAQLSNQLAGSIDVRRLRPGHLVRFHYDSTGTVDAVQMKVTGWGEVGAVRNGNAFDVKVEQAQIRTVEATISSTVHRSLYEALRDAGEGPQVGQQLIDVFQWDIDFFELRKGDSFSFVVTKRYAGTDLVGYGPVTAARFTHRGNTYEAFRHEMTDGRAGYYASTGTPLRKQFLKAPLKFSRVTSGFTKKRFHPVLKYFRPHYGVDYGAPVGTPVMSTADGVVVEARYKTGEGNFIRVRHSSRIDTCYLHLSRFAKDLKKGTRVSQGQVIGYVGMTGLATGPHLDYRVSENGKWLDPLKLKSITPDPLRGDSLRRFRSSVARLQPSLTAPESADNEKPVPQRALF